MAAPTSESGEGPPEGASERSLAAGGAAPYGNFPDYSRFHPPEELSTALYRHLLGYGESETSHGHSVPGRDLCLLCCDIDPGLIERAKQHSPFPGAISYATLDIMDINAREMLLSSYLSRFGRSAFDICFCMSVTMWIHLNHGDSGLVKFLSCLASKCTYLLIEPQPWKCYRAAARRLRKLGRNDFDHFRLLTISGNMAEKITQILAKDCAMELMCCFGSTSWDRSILLFKSTLPEHLL
ncbi:RNA 5'-monophosphate methyltransferase isoform X2 [Sceloporus undulatus]|uniref:RNA 5'-monophosphate methyltransferase isoform X2 n=1 Tax=Sceloporus undulatus TaxID=8520 RepID=UPI001C4CCAF5|nr:RNA 5'-monophosphate methyltransferase isoform X2 [Sceloporus undulatus]